MVLKLRYIVDDVTISMIHIVCRVCYLRRIEDLECVPNVLDTSFIAINSNRGGRLRGVVVADGLNHFLKPDKVAENVFMCFEDRVVNLLFI